MLSNLVCFHVPILCQCDWLQRDRKTYPQTQHVFYFIRHLTVNSHLCWSLHVVNEGCVKTKCSLELFLRLISHPPVVFCSLSHLSSRKWPQRQTRATLTTSSLHRPLLSRHLTNVSTSVLPPCLSACDMSRFFVCLRKRLTSGKWQQIF